MRTTQAIRRGSATGLGIRGTHAYLTRTTVPHIAEAIDEDGRKRPRITKNEEGVFDDSISEEQRNYWIDEELKIILDWENKNAECDDEHCVSDEDAKASWLEVVECMARIGERGKHKSPDAIRFGDMC